MNPPRLFRPIKRDWITQGFGKVNTMPSLLPIYQSLGLQGHDGIDFAVSCKDNFVKHGGQCENVYCNIDADLEITYIQKDDDKGWGIIACTPDKKYKYLWWHFDVINPLLYVGAKLSSGDLLGTSGDTGISTGAHVHFGFYPYTESYDNGYKGAASPEPYFENVFVLDKINNLYAIIAVLQKIINLILGK